MNCSIINDTIQLHIEGASKDMDVLLQSSPKTYAKAKITAGSAL